MSEIIIDRIDVSGCENSRKEHICFLPQKIHAIKIRCYSSKTFCEDFKDCSYKQLQREKAETKKYNQIAEFYEQKAEKLEAENERLKECLKKIEEIADIMYNTNCNYIVETEKILLKISEVKNGN